MVTLWLIPTAYDFVFSFELEGVDCAGVFPMIFTEAVCSLNKGKRIGSMRAARDIALKYFSSRPTTRTRYKYRSALTLH